MCIKFVLYRRLGMSVALPFVVIFLGVPGSEHVLDKVYTWSCKPGHEYCIAGNLAICDVFEGHQV